MTQNKRFSALLLALAILLTLAPQAYFLIRADADDSGKCGQNLYWKVTKEGNIDTLTITGTGDMQDYHLTIIPPSSSSNAPRYTSDNPWNVYPDILSLSYGITSIGSYAFLGMYIREATLPASVTRIGQGAFDTRYIEDVTIYNKNCEIYDAMNTLGNAESSGKVKIHGYTGSTAQAYARKYGSKYIFVDLETGQSEECPFNDVKSSDYFYGSVLWAVEQGVTTGTSDTTFSPQKACTRGEVGTFLWRANGKPEPQSSSHSFVDIDSNAYYYKAVLWAVEKGITNGMDATHFMPKNTCNRGQVVTFLWRAKGEPEPKQTSHPFVDVDEKAFYYQAMLWAVENKITNGMDATHFQPSTTCNRGQVVTFLYRAKDVAAKNEELSAIIWAISSNPSEMFPVTLTVKARGGTAPYTYKWQMYSESRERWGTVVGQTGTSYTVDSSGRYRCQVTDVAGTVEYSNELVLLPPE